jgi:hypothetical protein
MLVVAELGPLPNYSRTGVLAMAVSRSFAQGHGKAPALLGVLRLCAGDS